MTRLNNHHRQNHAPEYTGDLSFVGKVREIYLEISGQSKVSAWKHLETSIQESLSKWSYQELQELNTLPGVQSTFEKELELSHGYFTENDWNNLERWYIENRGTGENDSILKSKFVKYKNNYQNQLYTYLIREYGEVLGILIKRAQESTSGKIGERSQQLLNEIQSIFPKETEQLLQIKAIKNAHAKNAKKTITLDDDTGVMKSIKERVKNTLKWGNKSIKNLKKQKRRVLGILLVSGAALVGGGHLLKEGELGGIESIIREENDTLTLSSRGFSQIMEHKNSIPWEVFTDSNLMDTLRLGCENTEQKWWEKVISFPKDYDVQTYRVDSGCTIKAIRGNDSEKVRIAFQIIQTKKDEKTINVSISEFRELFQDTYTKKIITTLPKREQVEDISIEQIQSILNAVKSVKTIKVTDKETLALIQELIRNNLDTKTIIAENSWSQVIEKYQDYIGDKEKSGEKFEELANILTTNGFILTIDTVPNLEWPQSLKGEALMRNALFQIGINGIVENFVSKKIENPSQEITEAVQLLLESESNLDPKVKNKTGTSASGLFQILQSHMHTFGWGNKKITDMNPIEQAKLFNKFIDRNFAYQGEHIKMHMQKLGAFAGWMGSAHINNRWASEPRLRVSGFDNFPQYLSKQEDRMEQSSFRFSNEFKERVRLAKITLQRVLEHTKNIPQSMETPTLPEELNPGVIEHINTTYLESLRPTSGTFVKRSLHDRRTQIGGDGTGKEHYGSDLIPIDNNYTLQPLLKGDGVIKFTKVFSGYGNTLIEAKKLRDGGYIIALAGHLDMRAGKAPKIGSTGASTGVHLHVEFFKVGVDGVGHRVGPPWSGLGTLNWKQLLVVNKLDHENAGFFFSDIFPQVKKLLQ